jgi:hypothetical protein
MIDLYTGTLYFDHCQAYVNAIGFVIPEAPILHDNFHILQNQVLALTGETVAEQRIRLRFSKSVQAYDNVSAQTGGAVKPGSREWNV